MLFTTHVKNTGEVPMFLHVESAAREIGRASAPKETQRFRPKAAIWTEVLVIFSFDFVVSLVFVAVLPGSTALLALVAGIFVAAWGCRRAARISLSLAPEGVTVQNLLRRHVIAWRDIEAVVPTSDAMGVIPRPCIGFRLHDRQALTVSQATLASPRTRTQVIHALKEWTAGTGIEIVEQ
jgi:hypothetical protein